MDSPVTYPTGTRGATIFEGIDLVVTDVPVLVTERLICLGVQVNILFTVELFIHVCARGFVFNREAYLRQDRFQLDFVVVVFSWLQAVPGPPEGLRQDAVGTFLS